MTKSTLELKITDICNLNCKHCLWTPEDHPHKETNYHAIVNYITDHKEIKKIGITGGEPLLDECNINFILRLKDSFPDIKFLLVTNLCYPLNYARKNLLYEFSEIQTSFDTHIRFGNIKNLLYWRRNIKLLLKMGIHIRVSICITKYLVNQDPKRYAKFFHHLGAYSYSFINLFDVGRTHKNLNELMPERKEYHDWVDKVIDMDDSKCEFFNFVMDNKFGCDYKDSIAMDVDGTPMHCMCYEKKDQDCTVSPECLSCNQFSDCGGRCAVTPCIYYNKEQYKKIRDKVIRSGN